MRKSLLFLCTAVAVVAMAGCSKEAAVPLQSQIVVPGTERVIISRNLDFGRVNDKKFAVFTAAEDVESFASAVKTAQKIKSALDIAHPDYDIVFENLEGNLEMHFWIGESGGMFVFSENTGTGYKLQPNAARMLYELMRQVRYNPDHAESNGDVVQLNGEVRNTDRWFAFVEHVHGGEPDAVQVVQYTEEGAPIFSNLTYDGEMIRHRYDNRMDGYGKPEQRFEFCNGLDVEESEQGASYRLSGCENREGTFQLFVPHSESTGEIGDEGIGDESIGSASIGGEASDLRVPANVR